MSADDIADAPTRRSVIETLDAHWCLRCGTFTLTCTVTLGNRLIAYCATCGRVAEHVDLEVVA